MSKEAKETVTNTAHDLPNHSCVACLNSQISSTTNVHSQRTRRSLSCPDNFKEFLPVVCEPRKNSGTGITKRWHSIPTIYIQNNSFQLPSNEMECRNISDGRSSSVNTYSSQIPSLAQRITCLFALGAFLALLLNFLQKQKQVTVFSSGVFGDVLNSAWWIPPTFGLAAIVIGLIYPKLDQLVGNPKRFHYEWSSVMRCIAVFVGINHASARIDFDSNVHLSLTLAILSLGLWYFFDQSIAGLGMGLLVTGIATAVTQILVAMEVFGYSNPDFIYMQSWVPCLYFSGGVTIGACGRALASLERERTHYHLD